MEGRWGVYYIERKSEPSWTLAPCPSQTLTRSRWVNKDKTRYRLFRHCHRIHVSMLALLAIVSPHERNYHQKPFGFSHVHTPPNFRCAHPGSFRCGDRQTFHAFISSTVFDSCQALGHHCIITKWPNHSTVHSTLHLKLFQTVSYL
jgi:hypothetical protein